MLRWAVLFTLALLSTVAKSDVHIIYDGDPIHISLMLGEERQIVFPGPITVGIPQKLLSDFKTSTPIGNRLFIEPAATFKDRRILVKGNAGKTYVIYLTATKNNGHPLDKIVRIYKKIAASTQQPPSSGVVSSGPRSSEQSNENPPLSYRYLTQFMVRKLYAPKRLELNDSRLTRVSVSKKPTRKLFNCAKGNYSCIGLLSTPLLSYRAQNSLYVSSIEVKNISDVPISINPTLINAQFLAATPYHSRLLPSTYPELSSTTLVIISRWPLGEILK